MTNYVIALIDEKYGCSPIFYAEFGNGTCGTSPKREDAFVVDESNADTMVETVQRMANRMADYACILPRKAVKWEVRK